MKITRLFLSVPLILALMSACSSTSRVNVQVMKPAEIHLQGIHQMAVVDFQGPERSGSQVATTLQSLLLQKKQYTLIERDKLKQVLEEQNLAMTGVVDEASAVEIGRILGVDAMIFGEVTQYQVERDENGVEKVSKKEGTGKYEWVEQKNIFTGKKQKVKKEIMKTVLVDQHYKVRRGTVAINFRVVNVETGVLLAVHSDSKSYDSGKVVEGSGKSLKPKGQILAELAREITKRFANMISIHELTQQLYVEPGKGNIDLGRKYAENGLWPEAVEAWEQAVTDTPKEPAVYYNLGVAYEIDGEFDKAEELYKKAMSLKQTKRYMQALARLRKARMDQAELEQQIMDRQTDDETDSDY
ncbi:tetratricopeptide repeat protein [bacterium]|nr:tetratricopeptide repeat protein [bacterium]